jgi:hypothetical protein
MSFSRSWVESRNWSGTASGSRRAGAGSLKVRLILQAPFLGPEGLRSDTVKAAPRGSPGWLGVRGGGKSTWPQYQLNSNPSRDEYLVLRPYSSVGGFRMVAHQVRAHEGEGWAHADALEGEEGQTDPISSRPSAFGSSSRPIGDSSASAKASVVISTDVPRRFWHNEIGAPGRGPLSVHPMGIVSSCAGHGRSWLGYFWSRGGRRAESFSEFGCCTFSAATCRQPR